MKKTITILTVLLYSFTYSQTPNYVPTNGLVGYWPFSGNANDASGNGNNGTVQGALLTTDRFGDTNKAYSFNGDDTITVVNPISLPVSNNSFTISVWFNSISWLYRGTLIGWGLGSGAGNEANYLRTDENGGLLHYFWLNDLFASTSDLSGSWHQAIVTFNGNQRVIYIDGSIVNSGMTGTVNVSSTPITIGSQQADPAGICGSCGFNGKLDDIGIWNRVLTQQEITALYNGADTTSPCTVYDTTYVTVYDTVKVFDTITTTISVTDTLLIDFATGIAPPNSSNTLKVYPNPAKDHLVINNGNLAAMTGYSIKITNALGQVVFNQPVNQQQFYIDLSSWGGTGTYILYVIDGQQTVKETKEIVLQ